EASVDFGARRSSAAVAEFRSRSEVGTTRVAVSPGERRPTVRAELTRRRRMTRGTRRRSRCGGGGGARHGRIIVTARPRPYGSLLMLAARLRDLLNGAFGALGVAGLPDDIGLANDADE